MPRQAIRKRLVSTLGYVVLLLLALEIGARLAWKLDRNVPFFQPHRLIEGSPSKFGEHLTMWPKASRCITPSFESWRINTTTPNSSINRPSCRQAAAIIWMFAI